MRLGSLLVEAKLTEGDFQARAAAVVEGYRDFDAVFERELLPRAELATKRRRDATEFPEDYSQDLVENGEWLSGEGSEKPTPGSKDLAHSDGIDGGTKARTYQFVPSTSADRPRLVRGLIPSSAIEVGYAGYQLIRNVLAAYAEGCSFCVVHDNRRPDLREAWFEVLAAVKSAELRVRLSVLTWQELAEYLPMELQGFLDWKYGIVGPGKTASSVDELVQVPGSILESAEGLRKNSAL
jgi:hypothetical protein